MRKRISKKVREEAAMLCARRTRRSMFATTEQAARLGISEKRRELLKESES